MAKADLKEVSKQHQRTQLMVDNLGREWVIDSKGNKKLKNLGVAANYVGGDDADKKKKSSSDLETQLSEDDEAEDAEDGADAEAPKKKKGCTIL